MPCWRVGETLLAQVRYRGLVCHFVEFTFLPVFLG